MYLLCVRNQGRRDILRVLLRQLPCPYRRNSDPKSRQQQQQQESKASADTGANVDDAVNSFKKLTIESETERTAEGSAEHSEEVDEATLALLAANSHGYGNTERLFAKNLELNLRVLILRCRE